jgi:Tol biopolymer transport system component
MDLQGSGVATLEFGVLLASSVAWRPDGQRVIVSLESCGSWYDPCSPAGMVLLAPDGNSRMPVSLPADIYWVNGITWSPDGSTIAFGCSFYPDIGSRICSMRADGASFRLLTPGVGYDIDPAWSPDGRIAFASLVMDRWRSLLMNPDGTQVTRLSQSAFGRQPTSWSPDGTRLGYALELGISVA